MITSMTGYSRLEKVIGDFNLQIEIKSLNSRYIEIIPKIDELLIEYETDFLDLIKKECIRGKIYFSINLKKISFKSDLLNINKDKLKIYLDGIEKIKKEIKSSETVSLEYFLKIPDVFEYSNKIKMPKKKIILDGLKDALVNFKKYRIKEGTFIKKDILLKIKIINKEIKKIIRLSAGNSKQELNRIREKISNLISNAEISEERLLQEVAIILEKKDINEELSRLNGHLELLQDFISSNKDIGKKSNFLLQEISREVNTIGSKVDNLETKHLVVSIKEKVEQIREQVQNIL